MTRTTRSLLLALVLALPASVSAQVQAGVPSALDATKAGFDEVAGWIVKAADMVPESQFGYRPIGTVRTVGQLVGHIADGNNYYCRRASGTQVQWSDSIAQSGARKAELIAKLKDSIALCAAAHTQQNAGRIPPLIANVGHASLHYGNLVTYMRMLGLTPPSS